MNPLNWHNRAAEYRGSMQHGGFFSFVPETLNQMLSKPAYRPWKFLTDLDNIRIAVQEWLYLRENNKQL